MSTATSFRFTGWHFLACMVVFFGIDIAVNVAFIVRAVQTFPGEVADDPYEAEVAYDQTLAQEAIEQKLGWMAVINDAGHAPQGEAISVHWTDRAGRPLSGLTVTGLRARRPPSRKIHRSASAKRRRAPIGPWPPFRPARVGPGRHRRQIEKAIREPRKDD